MQGMVPQYLEAAMDAFQRNQSAVQNAFKGNVLTDLAKRNMAMFEDASKVFTAAAGTAAAAGGAAKPSSDQSEVEQLRAELAALQAKVDKLGR
jgi:polyhydroxyalkanoate synthesis regulator protein